MSVNKNSNTDSVLGLLDVVVVSEVPSYWKGSLN